MKKKKRISYFVSCISFQVSVETQSLKFEKLARVANGESFLVVPRIKCTSHVPITLTNSSLSLASEVHQIGTDAASNVVNTELSEGEMGVDCFCIAVDDKLVANSAVTLGQYVLYWKR
ncbi:Trafficking protein particle complex subunit 11 [Portunus trituberculatus]|uniref:Trafficking protein particle complex subunit 11 n=1 Tax=Portunus trituberculatus TaxID=210409 RepID=A0A5B7K2M5_PORTR|nr:Trafficking protein particle complex subunit 11 [Portunus trituberculatus]